MRTPAYPCGSADDRSSPGKSESWSPKVAGLGLNKRELLREILPLFGASPRPSACGADVVTSQEQVT